MKSLHRIHQVFCQEEGASLVYVTLILLVLFGFAGLAVDGSNAYFQRRRLQTAADAAALAGARSLALAQNRTQIGNEIDNVAVDNNGASDASWTPVNSNTGVTVEATEDIETFFARAIGINSLAVSASATADIYSITKTKTLFPLTVECDCVQFEEVDMVPVVNNFCATSQEVPDYHTWSIWLRDLDPLYHDLGENPDGWYYAMDDESGLLTEYHDGSARIAGRITNAAGDGFDVDILLEGRTSEIPIGSPELPMYGVNTEDWYYYTELSGTLLGIPGSRYEGAALTLTPRGASFQVGLGASLWEDTEIGGAGGFTWVVAQQPTTGVVFPSDPDDGSINLRLGECNNNIPDLNTVTSDDCNFKWIDWNGGSSSARELGDDIRNQNRSGAWQVYDWISSGPDACDAAYPTVQSALRSYLNKEVTIALYDDDIDEVTAAEHPGQMQICGFARWKMTDFNFDGGTHRIEGTFVRGLVRGEPSTIDGDYDFGARDVRLQ